MLVHDTDVSYRPRVTYTQWMEAGAGWWQVCVGKTGNVSYQVGNSWRSRRLRKYRAGCA